jgi:hypothetical protein
MRFDPPFYVRAGVTCTHASAPGSKRTRKAEQQRRAKKSEQEQEEKKTAAAIPFLVLFFFFLLLRPPPLSPWHVQLLDLGDGGRDGRLRGQGVRREAGHGVEKVKRRRRVEEAK